MSDQFLQLSEKNRRAILVKAAQTLGRSAKVLEKDVWVCWTLQKLVEMPGVPPFVLKGGTSLSKAYEAIARFSEDVDVTLDRESLAPGEDPFEVDSNSQRKRIRKVVHKALVKYMTEEMKPYFDEKMRTEMPSAVAESVIDEEKTSLLIRYPSCVESAGGYMQEHIILELGGRNKITPAEDKKLEPYIKSVVEGVDYPEPIVSVLVPQRTFWEKATLIHVECNNPAPRKNMNKYSRHWYDLSQLAKTEIGESALEDLDLLKDVIEQKTVLFHTKHANYDQCVSGSFKLIPDDPLHTSLEKDFAKMIADQYFWEDPGTFDEILEQLASVEARINAIFSS